MRVWFGLLLTVMGVAGQTPDLFVAPGEVLGSAPEVAAYSSDPFIRVATIPTQPYVTNFLAHPDGTRYYSISRLGPDGVRVISTTPPYAELKRLPVVDTAAAAISPDGRRLVLIGTNNQTLQNTVTILDLQTDTVAAKLSIPYNLRDQVVIAQDSSRAFFLTISPGLLYAVDLTTNTLAQNPLAMPAGLEVRVGPNGLVYVTIGNRLLEIDGRTLHPWEPLPDSIRTGIRNVELTRDGEYAITNGELFHLPTRTFTPFPTGASWITEVGAKRALRDKTDSQWSGGAVETFRQTPLPFDFWTGLATNEFPEARHLFALTFDELRRYSLAGQVSAYQSLSVRGRSVSYQPRPGTGAPARMIGIQTEQTVRRSDNPKPMVARVLNAEGKPLANVAVSFQSTLVSAILNTDSKGNAVLNLSAGSAPGRYTVIANAAGVPAVSYNMTIEEDPSGARQLTLLAGAGQYDSGDPFFGDSSPIVVQLKDSLGRPRPREAVIFRTASRLGTFVPEVAGLHAVGECKVFTDANGEAAVNFVPSPERFDGARPEIETIVATSGGARVEVLRTVLPRSTNVTIERLSPTGPTLSGVAGAVVPGGFRVRVVFVDRAGNRIPLAAVRIALEVLSSPRAEVLCESLTDTDGYAGCDLRLPTSIGRWRYLITVGRGSPLRIGETFAVATYGNRPQVELSPATPGETGADRTFEISAFRPETETPFGILNLLVNSALDGRRACYVAYSIAEERLYLVNDEGPEAGLSAPLILGGAESVANAQCTVFGAGSSFSGTAARPVLKLRIRFAPGFSGARIVQIASRTRNDAESSGWQPANVITLPSSNLATGPRVAPMSPSVYPFSSAQLDFEYADANGGSANLLTVWGLIGPSVDAGTGCVFAYYAPGNLITLYPDNGVPSGALVPFRVGEVLENSRCRLEPVLTERRSNGLLVRVRISAKPAFAGSRTIWGAASTLQNAVSPWTPIAAWRIQAPYN